MKDEDAAWQHPDPTEGKQRDSQEDKRLRVPLTGGTADKAHTQRAENTVAATRGWSWSRGEALRSGAASGCSDEKFERQRRLHSSVNALNATARDADKKTDTSTFVTLFCHDGVPEWLSGKESASKEGDAGSTPGSDMATHSCSCLENPTTERPGGLQSMELQRVRHDLKTRQHPCFLG